MSEDYIAQYQTLPSGYVTIKDFVIQKKEIIQKKIVQEVAKETQVAVKKGEVNSLKEENVDKQTLKKEKKTKSVLTKRVA